MKKSNVLVPSTRRSFFGSLGKGLTSIAAISQIFYPGKVSASANIPNPCQKSRNGSRRSKEIIGLCMMPQAYTKDSQLFGAGSFWMQATAAEAQMRI